MSAPALEQKVQENRKEKPSALRSVIAGATAGAVEICEYAPRISAADGAERKWKV